MKRWGLAAGILLTVLLALFPFYWATNGALQPTDRLFAIPADYFPVPASLDSFRSVLSDASFIKALRNSFIVASGATAISLFLGALAAYALGRLRVRGRTFLLGIVLTMTMFPQISVLGALYETLVRLELYNRRAGLMLSYLVFLLPLTIWILTQFMRSFPIELEESAYLDGAGPLRIFVFIVLPLLAPAMATTALLAFIAAWNEYLFALAFTITDQARTVPVAIASFSGDQLHQTPWGSIMAASVFVTLPVVALVLALERWIVSGLTAGAVKS